MYKIKVPATSANVGAGFDSSGIAVSLYNTVYLAESDRVDIRSMDGVRVPTDASNLIFQAAKRLYDRAGLPLDGLTLRQYNEIPLTRGLGSSSACIVAGLLGANALLGERYEKQELMDIAARMEGHPDNVIPAFSGGFSTSVIQDDGRVLSSRFDIEESLEFYAFVPPFELSTGVARSVIPQTVSHADAVFNLSRSGLLTAAFAAKDYRLLKEAVRDRLHQPFRLGMIPGGREVFEVTDKLGALAVYISGAGSTVMAIVPAGCADFFENAAEELKKTDATSQYRILRLRADNRGATVEAAAEIPQ